MERSFKDEALKVVNSFDKVQSVVCIASDGKRSSACIGSEGRENLQEMLITAMIKNNAVLNLFKAAVIAAEIFKGEEK